MYKINTPIECVKFTGDNLTEMANFYGAAYFQIRNSLPVIVKGFVNDRIINYYGVVKLDKKGDFDYGVDIICREGDYILGSNLFEGYWKVLGEEDFKTYIKQEQEEESNV